jgi:hypothetical protein
VVGTSHGADSGKDESSGNAGGVGISILLIVIVFENGDVGVDCVAT